MSADLVVLLTYSRPAPAISDQPSVTLRDWALVENVDGAHLCGFHGAGTLRQATHLVKIDPAERTCITQSGRRYHLQGPPRPSLVPDTLTARLWTAIQAAQRRH